MKQHKPIGRPSGPATPAQRASYQQALQRLRAAVAQVDQAQLAQHRAAWLDRQRRAQATARAAGMTHPEF